MLQIVAVLTAEHAENAGNAERISTRWNPSSLSLCFSLLQARATRFLGELGALGGEPRFRAIFGIMVMAGQRWVCRVAWESIPYFGRLG